MNTSNIEQVSPSDVLEMATWNRRRTSDELQHFISGRHASLADVELGI